MESRIYGPVTRAQTEAFLREAEDNGLTVSQTDHFLSSALIESTGQVTGFLTTIGYDFKDATQSLTLTLIHNPPFLGNKIWGQIEDRLPTGTTRKS